MKFIVDNYTKNFFSQPLYLVTHINETEEHEAIIYNFDRPVFDLMDEYNPDIIISSCDTFSKDLFLYLQDSNHKKLFVNIDNCKVAHIKKTTEILSQANLTYTLFGSLENKHLPSNIKQRAFRLLNCVDINVPLEQDKCWKNKINTLLISKDKDEAKKYTEFFGRNETIHILTTESNDGDIHASVLDCCKKLFKNYDKAIFTNIDDGFSQLFFESIYRCDKTYYLSSDDSIKQKIEKIFKVNKTMNWKDEDKMTDFSEIKQIVATKHLSTVRTNSFLSQVN